MNDIGGDCSDPVESTGDPALDEILARYERAADELAERDLTALVRLDRPSTGLHAAARRVEAVSRQKAAFDSRYIAALEAGDEPGRYAKTSTAVFLRDQLRIGIGDARRRIALAEACAPRVGLSGEPLPPRLPVLAAAVRAGRVSPDHASVVISVMDALPESLAEADCDLVEAQAVAVAAVADPGRLARWGTEALNRVDPDGALRDHEYAHARRGLTVTAHRGRAGGSIHGDLDTELLEKLQTAFDVLAAPAAPTTDPSGREVDIDERTPAARNHDALLDLVNHALTAGDLPASGGTPTSVVIHVTADRPPSDPDAFARELASTDHGRHIPLRSALAMADNSAIYALIKDTRGLPLWLGRTARIATAAQTIALAARDRGCTFPGCDRPPAWCQRHHVREWQSGGNTDVDNLTLGCGYHHREFERRGWRVIMVDGLPSWVPPQWIDPDRQPIRNHAHDFPDTG